jgi:hypothetical protein
LAVTLGVVACVVGAVGIAINGTFAGTSAELLRP